MTDLDDFTRGALSALIALLIAVGIAGTAYEAGRSAPRTDCTESSDS